MLHQQSHSSLVTRPVSEYDLSNDDEAATAFLIKSSAANGAYRNMVLSTIEQMPQIEVQSGEADLYAFEGAKALLGLAYRIPQLIPDNQLQKAFSSYRNYCLVTGDTVLAEQIANEYTDLTGTALDRASKEPLSVDTGFSPHSSKGVEVGQIDDADECKEVAARALDKKRSQAFRIQMILETLSPVERITASCQGGFSSIHIKDLEYAFENRALTVEGSQTLLEAVEPQYFSTLYENLANIYFSSWILTEESSCSVALEKVQKVAEAYAHDAANRFGEDSPESNRAIEFKNKLSADTQRRL